jgi:hypothetical protein
VQPDDSPNNIGVARAVSKEERKAAAAKRRAATAAALKKGEITANQP